MISSCTEDELTAKGRLFEAVAQLLNALAQRAPLVLFVDDLQWVDVASLDLLRYLGRFCEEYPPSAPSNSAFLIAFAVQ